MYENINKIHFVGICGSGMNPLAFLLKEMGLVVTGSDSSPSSTLQKKLEDSGIPIFTSHAADQVEEVDALVVSTAISETNSELIRAKEKHLPILHRSDVLLWLSQNKKSIFIAGSHGKTTTTALISHILSYSGISPTVVVGGRMLNTDSYHLAGTSEYFIAEADESDGSFLKYDPFISVITNIDYDHLDYYKTFENVKKAFLEFSNRTDEEGFKVLGWDCANLREVSSELTDFIAYGSIIGAHNRIISVSQKPNLITFKAVIHHDVREYMLPMIGKHNAENALAAITVATELGLTHDVITEAISQFKGVHRRLEVVCDTDSYTIINDFAHNPGKITSAIKAVSESFNGSNIIVVFQPHRYSRLVTMYDQFCGAFDLADQVIVTPIYAAGEKSVESINHEKLARDISHLSSVSAVPINDINQLSKPLNVKDFAHNVILMVGAGDIGIAIEPLMRQLGCSGDS